MHVRVRVSTRLLSCTCWRVREDERKRKRERILIPPSLQEQEPLAGLTSLPLRSTRWLLCAAYQFAWFFPSIPSRSLCLSFSHFSLFPYSLLFIHPSPVVSPSPFLRIFASDETLLPVCLHVKTWYKTHIILIRFFMLLIRWLRSFKVYLKYRKKPLLSWLHQL